MTRQGGQPAGFPGLRPWWIAVSCTLLLIANHSLVVRAGDSGGSRASSNRLATQAPFGAVKVGWSDSIAASAMLRVESLARAAFSAAGSESAFAAAMHRILVALQDDGYRDARVAPRDFEMRNGALEFVLNVTPGPRSRIVDYCFFGLAHTDTVWLKKQLAQPVDVPLTAEWLRHAAGRLGRLANVSIVAEPEIVILEEQPETNETLVIVHWRLRENRAARFDGLLAAGGESDQSGLTGRATIQFDGLFGRDRSVAVRYNRMRPQWNSLNLLFAERGAFGGPLDYALEFDASNQRDRRQRVAATVGYSLGRAGDWRMEGAVSWHRVTPGAEITSPSRSLDASLGFEKQACPVAQRPSRRADTHLGLRSTFSHRRVLGNDRDDAIDSRLRLDGEAGVTCFFADHWEFGLASVARVWLTGRDRLSYGDEWFLGGADYLRGYDDQAFAGASGLWGMAEAGYWLRPSLGISLFGEAAHFTQVPDGATAQTVQPLGYGWALRLISADRIGRLEFAWRRGAAWRDGFVRLKVTQSW